MPYEDSIQHLLVLFLQYKQARNQRDRSRIELEILQLFDTLGASLSPALLDVRGEFERIRNARTPETSPSRQMRLAANRFAKDRISRVQFAPGAPALTAGAKDMLRIPIIELYETAEYRNGDEADRSLALISNSLREEPHSRIEGFGPLRTSIAVIRAYAKNFCNIPPFCSGRQNE